MGAGRATGQYRARKPGLPAECRGHGNEPQNRFFNPRLFMIYYPDENNRQYNQLKFDYRYNSWAQNLTYKINYMDTSNPLEVWMTNPNLPDTHSHFVGFDYNWGIPEKQLRVFFYSNYTYRMNSLCQSMTYDAATGIRTYRPETVNGNWYYYGGFNTVAPIDKKDGSIFPILQTGHIATMWITSA